jgi:hypothetical protein
LGPAINSGRGLFLYGAPGNGKTSIAERVTRAFGQYLWIPRAIGVDGEIIRMFDPSNHEETPQENTNNLIDNRKIDKRWIRIRRPTIVVGGELTMDNLEVALNTSTGISEAPMQLKSNCGTLVIDDFGRQKMSTDELLNRWIVPLEKRYDYLNLASGKKIQVPFDQLIIFSTNLEPKDLVDDAFLPLAVADPTAILGMAAVAIATIMWIVDLRGIKGWTKAGKKVLILEKRNEVGGILTNVEIAPGVQAQVLRNQNVGRTCRVAGSGPMLVARTCAHTASTELLA